VLNRFTVNVVDAAWAAIGCTKLHMPEIKAVINAAQIIRRSRFLKTCFTPLFSLRFTLLIIFTVKTSYLI
jgi:hypothetical protein